MSSTDTYRILYQHVLEGEIIVTGISDPRINDDCLWYNKEGATFGVPLKYLALFNWRKEKASESA